MRKVKASLLLVLFLLLSLLSPLGAVNAADIRENDGGDDLIVADNVNDDLYATAAGDLIVETDVNGDVIAAAPIINIEGAVGEDAYLAGGSIDILDPVNGNLFVAGGTVDVSSNVDGTILMVGGILRITGQVQEDVLALAGQVEIEGAVLGDVRVSGGTVDITGRVEGDVITAAGNANIGGEVFEDVVAGSGNVDIYGPRVGGDVIVYNAANVDIDQDTVVEGQRIDKDANINFQPFNGIDLGIGGISLGDIFGINMFTGTAFIVLNIIMSIGYILLGLLVFYLAPVKSANIMERLDSIEDVLISFGVGILAFIIGFLLSIVLFISIIGWPILFVMLALAFIATILSFVYVGTAFGKFIFNLMGVDNWVLSLIVGVLLIMILVAVPIIGPFIWWLVFFIGVGAMVWDKYMRVSEAREKRK